MSRQDPPKSKPRWSREQLTPRRLRTAMEKIEAEDETEDPELPWLTGKDEQR